MMKGILLHGTQTHHTIMGTNFNTVKETSLTMYLEGSTISLIKKPIIHRIKLHSHAEGGHSTEVNATELLIMGRTSCRTMLATDGECLLILSSCNGCGVCITACHSENNVPVVGKDEVRRSRDMHWLRMDRYFSSIEDDNRKEWA